MRPTTTKADFLSYYFILKTGYPVVAVIDFFEMSQKL
jgi:hypothetical protein